MMVFENFLGITARRDFNENTHYYDENLMNEVEELEKILYPKQFSYAKCVRDKHNNLKPANDDGKEGEGRKTSVIFFLEKYF